MCFVPLWFSRQEWSVAVAPWIINIKEQGLAHCILWVKLRQDEIWGLFQSIHGTFQWMFLNIIYYYFYFGNFDKSYRCVLWIVNNSNTSTLLLIQKHLICLYMSCQLVYRSYLACKWRKQGIPLYCHGQKIGCENKMGNPKAKNWQ